MQEEFFNPQTGQQEDLPEATVDTSNSADVELTETLYDHYSMAASNWIEDAKAAKDFAHNFQYSEEEINALAERNQAAVPINVIWPAMEQAVAMLTANSPGFQATAAEDSDIETASAISDLLSHDWYKSGGNEHLKIALYDYYQTGRGVLMAYIDPSADYGRGAVRFRFVDALSVFPDPNSRDKMWRDAAHVIVRNLMSTEQIMSIWPDALDLLANADTTHSGDENRYASNRQADGGLSRGRAFDNHHTRYRVLERYSRVKVAYQHVAERPTGAERIFLEEEFEQYLGSPALRIQQEGGPVQHLMGSDFERQAQGLLDNATPTEDPNVFLVPASAKAPAVALELTTNAALVEEGVIVRRTVMLDRIMHVITIGGQLYWKGYLPTDAYPLVPMNGRWDHNPFPISDVTFVTPIQESINKLHSQIIANLSNSTNVKVLVPRGSVDRQQIELDFAKSGAAVIEYDAEMGQPTIVAPLPVPGGLFSYYSELKAQIERELGIFSMQQGDASAAPSTYKGTLAMDEFGQRRIKSKLDDIESALSQLGRVALQYMQYVYREERVLRILEPNNRVRETIINQYVYDDRSGYARRVNDVTVGEYDVRILAGSILPSNRWALLEYYMQLYQMQIIDQQEVLKKTDVVDAEGVIERMSLVRQLQQQLQALQEENKQLKGDLQTADRETMNARRRVAVAKTDADLHKITANAQASARIYEQELRKQISGDA